MPGCGHEIQSLLGLISSSTDDLLWVEMPGVFNNSRAGRRQGQCGAPRIGIVPAPKEAYGRVEIGEPPRLSL